MKPFDCRSPRKPGRHLGYLTAVFCLSVCFTVRGDIKVKGFPFDEKYQLPEIDSKQNAAWLADYIQLAEDQDVAGFAVDYPRTARDLRAEDPKLRVCVASGDVRCIPLIVEELRCPDRGVQVEAGLGLDRFVTEYEYDLIRRDPKAAAPYKIPPLQKGDVDLRALRWVFLDMLRCGEPNLQAYACDMVGFLGLKEFEPTLRAIHDSRNPAVYHAVEQALDRFGLTYTKRKDDYTQPGPVRAD